MHGTVNKRKVESHRVRSTKGSAPDRETVDLVLRLMRAKAREDFWTYRKMIRPDFIEGWWQEICSRHLQRFYLRYTRGEKPKMILMAPPQHGKSRMVTDFISWIEGKDPDIKSIFTSYSDALGNRTNSELQRIFCSPAFKAIFPKTKVNDQKRSDLSVKMNSEQIEFIGRVGSFRNTTVQGPITGEGLDFGFIDDPIKGRKEARSKLIRDNTWSWLTDDFFTRFSEAAAMLLIMTRWHKDDPAGRFLLKFPGEVEVISYPAIAVKDEEFRDKGEPLFPEHKSLAFLLERKGLMTKESWESVYQQNPIVVGGGIFPIEKFKMSGVVDKREVVSTIRYWDKAGTDDGGAWTCGVRMHKLKNGTFQISDVRRGQWSALKREQIIKQTCEQDNAEYSLVTWVEQEPGSGGKESAEATIRMLAGYRVKADKVTGSKEVRADSYAAQVQGGNVYLVAGRDWVEPFLDEHEAWPNDKFKDQVDASAGAFNKLTGGSSYDTTMSWVE